jgi:hypothetical protein
MNGFNPHPDPLPCMARERGPNAIPSPPLFGGEGQGEGVGCCAMDGGTP